MRTDLSHSPSLTTQDACEPQFPTASLSHGGQLFVWSLRQWTLSARAKRCIVRDMWPQYHARRCADAIALVDEMISLLALAAFRPVNIRCPASARVSRDELILLQSLQAIQRGNDNEARNILSPVISGRLSHSFCRVAQLYVESLTAAGMSVTGVSYLAAVGQE